MTSLGIVSKEKYHANKEVSDSYNELAVKLKECSDSERAKQQKSRIDELENEIKKLTFNIGEMKDEISEDKVKIKQLINENDSYKFESLTAKAAMRNILGVGKRMSVSEEEKYSEKKNCHLCNNNDFNSCKEVRIHMVNEHSRILEKCIGKIHSDRYEPTKHYRCSKDDKVCDCDICYMLHIIVYHAVDDF